MNLDGHTCPKCGAPMVLRTAKKGSKPGSQFYGCSKFPFCKGTRDYIASTKLEFKTQELPQKKEVATQAQAHSVAAEKKTPLTAAQIKDLQKLRDRLINLSSRNRSLRLNKIDAKWAFDLSQLNEFDRTLPNQIIEHLLKSDDEFPLLPKPTQETQELVIKLDSKLTHLNRNITEIHKETGMMDLNLGFPFISGIPPNSETIVQAPVFLLPVTLERKVVKKGASQWTLRRRDGSGLSINKTLFFALNKICRLNIPEQLLEEELFADLYGESHFVEWTRELLEEYGLPCGISENGTDEVIDPLRQFLMKDNLEEFIPGKLILNQNAVLGHFPQSASSVQKDYERFLESSQEDLEMVVPFLSDAFSLSESELQQGHLPSSHFGSDIPNAESMVTVDSRSESENFFLLPSDSSQDQIVVSLGNTKHRGLVVWGPPGSGKSQTIVNLISDSVSRGKKVLLVSQKRTALDVVYDRLSLKGLEKITALVHDSKEDRKHLYSKISELTNPRSDLPNTNVKDPSRNIEELTKGLSEVGRAYLDSRFGIRLGEMYKQVGSSSGGPAVDPIWKTRNFSELEAMLQKIRRYQSLRESIIERGLLIQRKSFASVDPAMRDVIFTYLIEVCDSRESNEHFVTASFYKTGVPHDLEQIPSRARELALKARSYSGLLRFVSLGYWRANAALNYLIKRSVAFVNDVCNGLKSNLSLILADESVAKIVANVRSGDIPKSDFRILAQSLELDFDKLRSLDQLRADLPGDVVEWLEGRFSEAEKSDWADLLQLCVFNIWIREVERHYACISLIRSGEIEKIRKQLGDALDSKTLYCAEQLVKKSFSIRHQAPQAMKKINAQVTKQRNIPSIRVLNEEFYSSDQFRQLLPIWLVSPESVSDALPYKKGLFDVVIFDEASQCTVETALPAIFRGKQIVVAGDEKQLPPNHLFEISFTEEDEGEGELTSPVRDEPSILTLAKKTPGYHEHLLEWHYRSHYEELINFSNQAFYEGRVRIAPNVRPWNSGLESAIGWHRVLGFWENRSNEAEAKEVVGLIREYLVDKNINSVGVITFNINQKKLILDLLDQVEVEDFEFAEALAKNRNLPVDKQLFVKNIENVQGDEREIIIFSVAYAPDRPGGRVQQQFGVLSQKGGENRLNVAISRAIRRIEIVCSIDPEKDLNTSASLNDGPKLLQKYLIFAKAVTEHNESKVRDVLLSINSNLKIRSESEVPSFMSPFEEQVFHEIEKLGYVVHTQVGQSGFKIDLAIVNPEEPDRYLLGIECDGAMYHSHISVRERDIFRQRFLERSGWKIHRIWSTNWWANKSLEMRKLQQICEELLAAKKKAS